MATKSVNWSYWAGLFDGEGCISVGQNNVGSVGLRIILASCYQEIIDRMYQLFEGSTYQSIRYKNQHRPNWKWSLRGQKAINFLQQIYPYSIIKKKEIEVALIFPVGKSGKKPTFKDKSTRIIIQKELSRLKKLTYQEVYHGH